MLDECKGERLEEVLAVMSSLVLKKSVRDNHCTKGKSTTYEVALEISSQDANTSLLMPLILAHRVSLRHKVRKKANANLAYQDLASQLELEARRTIRYEEQLKETISVSVKNAASQGQLLESTAVDRLRSSWPGHDGWLRTMLHGERNVCHTELLSMPFEKVWERSEMQQNDANNHDVDILRLEEMRSRIERHNKRLLRWKSFREVGSQKAQASPVKIPAFIIGDLRFDAHLENGHQLPRNKNLQGKNTFHDAKQEYETMIEQMYKQLADTDISSAHDTPKRSSVLHDARPSLSPSESSVIEEHLEHAGIHIDTVDGCSVENTSSPMHHSAQAHLQSLSAATTMQNDVSVGHGHGVASLSSEIFSTKEETEGQTRPFPKSILATTSENAKADAADIIIDSILAASPSPRKKHSRLSLADRTRMSMSRATSARELDDVPEMIALPTKSCLDDDEKHEDLRANPAERQGKHEALVERTRKSMAGFEAAQRKAQIDRRRSVKESKKKQRESTYFGRVEEEAEPSNLGMNYADLAKNDDAEQVFKSRPKIKTSPTASPFTKPVRVEEVDDMLV